jgi:hypothetical protein
MLRPYRRGIAKRHALYPQSNARLGSFVAQPVQPPIELRRPAYFNHAVV